MSNARKRNCGSRRARVRGVSLIELLVAVTIGGLLIFGATQVYVDSRATYEVNETAARLQETARYAMSVIEPDIRMSNYWGLVKGAGIVMNQAAPGAASAGAPTSCGNNYAHNLVRNIEGSNNTYALGCAALNAKPVTGSDTLTVRRAAVTPSTGAATGRLRICSTRVLAELVTDSSGCTTGTAGQINDLVVNAYYVDQDSTQRAGLPSLRRKALVALDFNDEEIIPGVEDMQVQFGVDPTGATGVAQRYINPEALGANEQIVAVRVWLLIRAENAEVGFTDNRTYEYADRDQDTGITANLNTAGTQGFAYRPADGFRRVLVSRTIQIRNALGT